MCGDDLNTSTVKVPLALDNVDANMKDNHGRTLLSYAAVNRHNAVVMLLTFGDAQIDSKDYDLIYRMSYNMGMKQRWGCF